MECVIIHRPLIDLNYTFYTTIFNAPLEAKHMA